MKELFFGSSQNVGRGEFTIIQSMAENIQSGYTVGKVIYKGRLAEISDKFAAMGIVGYLSEKDGTTVVFFNEFDFPTYEKRLREEGLW